MPEDVEGMSAGGTYAVISDVITRMALEDEDAGRHARATPARVTRSLLRLEWDRHLRGMKPHPAADIQQAFSLMVPWPER